MMARGRSRGPREDGTVIVWLLALWVMLLFLGGISLDLWRAFAARQALAGAVDAASVAGASAVDEAVFATENVVQLDAAEAERRAWSNLAAQSATAAMTQASVSTTEREVVVIAEGELKLTLLRVLLPRQRSLTFRATAAATARAAP